MDWGSGITYLGEASVKGTPVRFGIKDQDRLEHVSILGKSPARATLFAGMAIQDIERGIGTVLIDLQGEAAESVGERLSESARKRLIYLDPSDAEYPFSWNPLDDYRALPEGAALRSLCDLLIALYRLPLSNTEVSPLVERVASLMLADREATLLTLYELVAESVMRDRMLPPESSLRKEFDSLLANEPEVKEAIAGNGRYLAKDTLTRNIFGQSTSRFDLSLLASGGAIVLDLSRIRMFPTRVTPLVRLFAHASRVASELSGMPCALYAYESIRAFSDRDLEKLFSERKVSGVFSDSAYTEEEEEVRKYALARSGTVMASVPREGELPAVSELFFPFVTTEDVEKLDAGEMIMMLTIDAVRSRPFFARMLPLSARVGASFHDIHVASRERYATPRHVVDQAFQKKYAPPPVSKDADPGAFSSAFRSIFAKNAGSPPPAGSVPQGPVSPASPQPLPPRPAASPAADVNKKPPEISEEELLGMLHVEETPREP